MKPLLGILAVWAMGLALPLVGADRVALVIGVDSYDHLPKQAQLKVAVSDAKKMADTLRGADPPFAVTLLTDVKQDDAEEAFDDFLGKAKNAECVFLYFAGHGVEYFGTNYLIVRDTDISAISADVSRMKRRLGNEALSLQELVDSLDVTGAKIKLVVLDCCRDNPLEVEDSSGTRSVVGAKSGLAQVIPPSGTLISYSADAGQKANDGLFTEVLTNEIASSGLPILRVFASTREKVRTISTQWAEEDATKGIPPEFRRVRHEPAEYNKLDLSGLDFTFTRGVPAEVKVSEEQAGKMAEMEAQIASMKKIIESLEQAGTENAALREQLAKMEESLQAEKDDTKEEDVAVVGRPETEMPESKGESKSDQPPTMVRTEPEQKVASVGGTISFGAGRGMEGSKAGETRSFGGIDFVWCPPTGGKGFLMGSPEDEKDRDDDETQHRVILTRGFWMAQTECTQEQWENVMGNNPSEQTGSKKLPVENVNYDDVQGWLLKMNEAHPLPEGWKWALPTEAQWEYACRAGTDTEFAFGNSLGSDEANFDGDYPYGEAAKGKNEDKTVEVGKYQANEWGFLDMHGNVDEWCADWYGDYEAGLVTDPQGAKSGTYRVFRGGSWFLDGHLCRSADRHWITPDRLLLYLGFRPAINSTP